MSKPRVEITYCTKCRFLLRASWVAQELLASFEADLGGVTLVPGSGGVFEITLDGEVIAGNRRDKAMPEISAIKRAVRDRVAPDRKIGHDSPSASG